MQQDALPEDAAEIGRTSFRLERSLTVEITSRQRARAVRDGNHAPATRSCEEPPPTNLRARVVAHQPVARRPVVVAAPVSWRSASFGGPIVLLDMRDLATATAHDGPRVVRALLSWYGWQPKCGPARVTLHGPCTVAHDYTGLVVDRLGDG